MIYEIISVLCVILAGVFDAAQTVKKDNPPELTIIGKWIIEKYGFGNKMWKWYIGEGGNVVWNPSLPSIPFLNIWYGDFWHTMKIGWIYSFSIAIGSMFAEVYGITTGICMAIIFQFIEGTTFQAFYATIFRTDRKFSWKQFLSERNPFKNSHT